jgi:hypothetical protein
MTGTVHRLVELTVFSRVPQNASSLADHSYLPTTGVGINLSVTVRHESVSAINGALRPQILPEHQQMRWCGADRASK